MSTYTKMSRGILSGSQLFSRGRFSSIPGQGIVLWKEVEVVLYVWDSHKW